MTVYFDFDHTLFDTGRLKRGLREIFAAGGVSERRFDETYQALVNGGGYDPARQADLLTADWRDAAAKEAALAGVRGLLVDGGTCVFEGVPSLLTELRTRGDRLVLLTRGDLGWQQAKFACSGLAAHFDQVVITPDLKAKRLAELTKPEDVGAVVDDNPGELAAMMAVRPKLRYIYFHRPTNPHPGPGCEEAASTAEMRRLLLGHG